MADDEPLKILKHGVKAWNEWRRSNWELRPNLTGANLTGMELTLVYPEEDFLIGEATRAIYWLGADLCRTDLLGADFTQANLHGADLSESDLTDVKFEGAVLWNVNFTEARLKSTDFSNASFGWNNRIGKIMMHLR